MNRYRERSYSRFRVLTKFFKFRNLSNSKYSYPQQIKVMGQLNSTVKPENNKHTEDNESTVTISTKPNPSESHRSSVPFIRQISKWMGFGSNKQPQIEESDDEKDALKIEESFVNPMKSILTDQSSIYSMVAYF